MRTFFLSFCFFILPFYLNAALQKDIYRSNSNGLMLVKIEPSEIKDYKHILYVYLIDGTDDKIKKKVLLEDDKEIKRWLYYYTDNFLYHEKYYKQKEIKEAYRYDSDGHKIKQEEYKNNKKIRITTYQYNNDGLVDIERILNLLNKQTIFVRYRYDSDYRIKQIEKKYPDGRLVYWEAFFSDKGIIQKEFYTLKEERFTFWYNENGQEIKGEIKEITEEKEEKIKKEWITLYSDIGKKESKEENNYIIGKKIKTWYNSNYKETRVETYKNDEIFTIEMYDYNKNNKVTYYEKIKDLNSTKITYLYNENDNMIKSQHYQDDKLKKIITYNEDNSRNELLFGRYNKKILIEYDRNGKIISQGKYEE
ncbi:MAG: hypothetical protein KAT05_04060 [Spirochaetes bacterium]|nr:hypothetical protein [Spirochaetota bacterium]